MLPMLLSTSNSIKVYGLWLWDGEKPTKEEVERAIKEIESEKEAADGMITKSSES